MLLSPEPTAATPSPRTALLIFARSATAELFVRGWPRRLAPLLDPASRSRIGVAGLEVHFFIDGAALASSSTSSGENFHRQSGRDFGERLRHAVGTVADSGCERIIVVGSDCPDLVAADIARAAELLEYSASVLGPDHRGGLYLIGLHAVDRHLLDVVRWQHNTDCSQLKSLYAGRPIHLLPEKMDLDQWTDLHLFARGGGALSRWLAAQISWLTRDSKRAANLWVNLARKSEQVRRATSPPWVAC